MFVEHGSFFVAAELDVRHARVHPLHGMLELPGQFTFVASSFALGVLQIVLRHCRHNLLGGQRRHPDDHGAAGYQRRTKSGDSEGGTCSTRGAGDGEPIPAEHVGDGGYVIDGLRVSPSGSRVDSPYPGRS